MKLLKTLGFLEDKLKIRISKIILEMVKSLLDFKDTDLADSLPEDLLKKFADSFRDNFNKKVIENI